MFRFSLLSIATIASVGITLVFISQEAVNLHQTVEEKGYWQREGEAISLETNRTKGQMNTNDHNIEVHSTPGAENMNHDYTVGYR